MNKADCEAILRVFESLESALCGYSGDISIDEQLSWIYGILIGWSDEALQEFAENPNIGLSGVIKLKQYHNSYLLLKKELEKIIRKG